MVTQEVDPELTPSILGMDYTLSPITELLTAQTNDQERYTLTEKIIIELINKNNERKDLLENNEKLLKEQTDLLETKQREMLEKQNDLLTRRVLLDGIPEQNFKESGK